MCALCPLSYLHSSFSPFLQLCGCGHAQNFDEVLVPADHVSRSPNDTYYIDTDTVLRCHTSAHQAETLRKGERAFLVTGVAPYPLAGFLIVSDTPDNVRITSCTSWDTLRHRMASRSNCMDKYNLFCRRCVQERFH